MEAAGFIVGSISLGVTLCDGVVAYCRGWKHQDDDVRSLTALCEELKQLLQAIEQRVKGGPMLDPNIVAKLNDTFNACRGRIEAVLLLAEKYGAGAVATTWKEKARELAQRLKFPFEKKTLEELKDIMIAFRGNVNTAMGLLRLDLSMSTQEAVQTLRTDSTKNHLTILGEMQTMSGQMSQSVGTELRKQLPLLGNNLSQKIDNVQGSVETVVLQSSAAVSQSFVAEIDKRLPVLEGSVVASVAHQIDHSRSSIETRLTSEFAKIQSSLAALASQQRMVFPSMSNNIPEGQRRPYPTTESLELPICEPSLSLKKRKKRQRYQDAIEQKSSCCTCSPINGRISSFQSYRWGFRKESEASIIHERNCPFWYLSKTVTKYSVNFLLLQRLRIFGSINISGSPYASIFGWSLSQNLTYRAVVPDDAPAFKALQRYLAVPGPQANGYETAIISCCQDLMAIFQGGHGSPSDILTDGTTLIERAFQLMGMNNSSKAHALWHLTRELLELGVEMSLTQERFDPFEYHKELWPHFHDNIFSGYTVRFPKGPISQVKNHAPNVLEFLSWLMKHDIEILYPSRYLIEEYVSETRPWHGFKIILNALRLDEDFSIASGCGVLSTAVLRRDKLAVEKTLDQHPQLLKTERNVFGQSPIHLAIGWPDGLELLLRAADESLLHKDINIMDENAHLGPTGRLDTLLDYAIVFGCTESIRILADADVVLDFKWSFFVGTDSLDPEVSQVVLDITLERLRQLLEFGKQKLPAEKFSSFQITNFESFDLKARALLDCLHAQGIQVPRKFARVIPWLEFGGVFHQEAICRGTAMAFFQAGFNDIDSEVEQITPLMKLNAEGFIFEHQFCFSRYFHVVEFFVEKGGRLDRRIPSKFISRPLRSNDIVNSYRVIHRIASWSWFGAINFEFIDDVVTAADLGSSRIWRTILQSNTSDPCICACASGGCRPISLALKLSTDCTNICWSYFRFRDFRRSWEKILDPQHWELAVELLSNLAVLLNGLEGEQLAEDIIRFLTFSALGLSHTCCRHMWFYPNHPRIRMIEVMDPADVEEIRDEEAELIERLNYLVDRFMTDFHELGLPISQFLLGKWQETILAELLSRDETPKQLREQLAELGVTLYDDPSSDDKDGDDGESKEEDYWASLGESEKLENDAYDAWIHGVREKLRSK